MTETLAIGYLPLVDAAPLIVADVLGFAEEEGLRFDLVAAPSWSGLRDLLADGRVTAAQMLSPVPVAQALGLGGAGAAFEALSVLNVNGNAIGASQPLAARMRDAGHDFAFTDARAAGLTLLAAAGERVRIGVPFAFSMHMELVRYWLEGLEAVLPQGLEIITVPPPRMAEALAAGEIDAFCVGEPRGSVAVEMGAGSLILPGSAIWANAPEKVLATRQGWAEDAPGLAGRLIRAVWRAGRWLSRPENHLTAGEVLANTGRLSVTADVIERSLTGRIVIASDGAERQVPRFIEFHEGAATFPWRSQAAWIGMRLAMRHGLDPQNAAIMAQAVFRSDLHRLHLADVGADLPVASAKVEGAIDVPRPVASQRGRLILPTDRFFDARIFDPADPVC